MAGYQNEKIPETAFEAGTINQLKQSGLLSLMTVILSLILHTVELPAHFHVNICKIVKTRHMIL
jgi:hypothetical protein